MRMMKLVRSHKQSRRGAVLAVIREDLPQDELHDPAYQYVALQDIRRRAEQQGYQVEEFWLDRNGLGPERLCDILQARGIEGIIVSPQSSRMLCARLTYAPFAAATFGYGLRQPSLHRAAGNMTLGIHMATTQLAARGYQRIGLAITQWVDERAENAYSGAMLHYQQGLPRGHRVPVLRLPHNNIRRCAAVFTAWVKTHRPDALISFDAYVPDWLKKLGLRIPEDIGLVVHDWVQRMQGFTGIHQRRDHVASAAVDLVTTQLMHHERGVPEVPRQILIPPAWIEGASIRTSIR
jgi:LacI family transcriptional regulator